MRLFILNVLFCFVANNHGSPVQQDEVRKSATISNENKPSQDITDSKGSVINTYYEDGTDNKNVDAAEVYKDNRLVSEQPTLTILDKMPFVPNYYTHPFTPVLNLPYSNDWNTPWQRNEYRIDNVLYPDLRYVDAIGSYGGIQYPYAHPNLFATFNNFLPVTYLPSVTSAHVGKSAPLSKVNHPMPVFRRRVRHSKEEDDFLAELRHMAMMNNILPTMPIPFVRSVYGTRDPAYTNGRQIALFPRELPDCALPVLLSCSPKVSWGVVAKPTYHGHTQQAPYAENHRYKTQPDLNEEVAKKVSANVNHHNSKIHIDNKGVNVSNENISIATTLDKNDKIRK